MGTVSFSILSFAAPLLRCSDDLRIVSFRASMCSGRHIDGNPGLQAYLRGCICDSRGIVGEVRAQLFKAVTALGLQSFRLSIVFLPFVRL